MRTRLAERLLTLVGWLLAALAVKTVVVVLLSYPDYFPPRFQADFLLGRRPYFWGAYAVAFYTHITSGPFTLAAGLLLLSDRFRRRWPAWHRRLGRVQVACILLAVVPSGLWMSAYAATGWVAGLGFATLSIVTAVVTVQGWHAAIARRFGDHRRWMQRCYALLASAVVLRLIGGLSDMAGVLWTYPIAAWFSWIGPLMVLEGFRLTALRRSSLRRQP